MQDGCTGNLYFYGFETPDMSIIEQVQQHAIECLKALYQGDFTEKDFQVNQTKPEFRGDYTVVLFSLVKSLKLSPDEIGQKLGAEMARRHPDTYLGFNIIKGFLNLEISDAYWVQVLEKNFDDVCFGKHPMNGKKVRREYSSPNTNKPLHLGHLRNNFLGWSVAEILKANGYEVWKSSIVNDRGIHICKSMIAWKLFANGATPASTNTKGDHFVGDYYVRFNDEYKKQVAELMDSGQTEDDAKKNAPIMLQAQQMLVDWEKGDPEVLALWKTMNQWVYEGFDITYKNIGCDFDIVYYESNTYLLGKDLVKKGLEDGVFYRREDGSVWIDLAGEGLDEKLVQRKDGTSVYITQDIGLAQQKYDQYKIDKSIYVIGDEQNYHMKVLQKICEKMRMPFAADMHHLSYGMVELPSGKMKSREGTVVDADDMVKEMEQVAENKTLELGKVGDFTESERLELYHTIGLGALKFFLLRVDPKKKMIFNPEESIDFHGFTAPFIQFNYARIRSILRKNEIPKAFEQPATLLPLERELLLSLEKYPVIIRQSAQELNPSLLAIYAYQLAKTFSSFYAEHSIASAESHDKKRLRLMLASMTAQVIKSALQLLGISVPERM